MASQTHGEEITCGWEHYAPYQFAGDTSDNTPQGLDVELMNAIAAHAGMTVRWVEAPWKRQLLMVENGTLHVAVSASHTAQREEYAHFSRPYRSEEPMLFVRKGTAEQYSYQSIDDLLSDGDLSLGVARGYVYSPDWESRMAGEVACRIVEATTEEHLVRILAAGRIQGALLDRFSGGHMVSELNLTEAIERDNLIISSVPIHIMASRTSVDEATLARLNAAIEALNADGTVAEILARYE